MGTAITVVAIVFGAALAALSMILSFVTRLIRRDSEATGGDDARLIQEMHNQLTRLEHRIESLETIITRTGKTTSHSTLKDLK